MGDLINNFEVFKKLGFDSSNQWIFYDERFQTFFNVFADNITEDNILTEQEVLERNELQQRKEYLPSDEINEKLSLISKDYPGLLEYTDDDIEAMENEVKTLETIEEMYQGLTGQMRVTKLEANSQLVDLEHSISELENHEKNLNAECMENAKALQELQKENKKLCDESKECYTKIQSPPLFMHQLPIDQYFLKCDSFRQYLTLYMKENFKIKDFLELDDEDNNIEETVMKLENIRKLHLQYLEKYIKAKAQSRATQAMIESLDVTHMHIISLSDMKKETRELELVNHHHFNITYNTLLNDLIMHLEQKTQQQMELVLYENTKEKFDRAGQRLENVKFLTRIVSDALSNAELVWIATQLDLERQKNRFDNTDELLAESQKCLKRIDLMRNVHGVSSSKMSDEFVGRIAEILSKHSNARLGTSPKTCLYEYEKFCRLFKYGQNAILNRKHYGHVLELIREIERTEKLISPYVYDSPVARPMFENVRLLRPIFNAKLNKQKIEQNIRALRSQFQENITERMNSDKLWRYSQLLWIWFLTEPKRVLYAVEEVRKAAAKIPTITGVKTLGGIKRK